VQPSITNNLLESELISEQQARTSIIAPDNDKYLGWTSPADHKRRIQMLKRIAIMLTTVAVTSQLVNVMGQTTPNPLEDQVGEAEARAKIAKARREEADNRFPKPDGSSLVGGTVVNGELIESSMLGYCAMKTAASRVSQAIINKPLPAGSTFVIYGEAEVKMISRYRLMMNRLDMLKTGYDGLCAGGACGAGLRAFGVGLAISKALDYLSLLKTDLEFSGTEVVIGDKEIVAQVFNGLPTYTLYYPQRVPLNVDNFAGTGPADNTKIFNRIILLGEAYDRARNAPAGMSASRERLDTLYGSTMKELGFGELPKAPPACPACPACPAAGCPSPAVTNVTVNVGENEKAESAGSGVDKTFYSYLQAERLAGIISGANAYWLDVQVVKAGGNMRIKSNFITNLMIGARVNFSGGAIVYFHVFDGSGQSKMSGILPVYEKYRKSDRISSTCN
jgi:hypothetical protein